MHVPQDDAEAADLVQTIVANYGGADLLKHGPDSYAFDMDVAGALQNLTIPTLILTGAQETVSRKEQASHLHRLLPDAREVVLDGGHLCNLTKAAAYNAAVIEFCGGIDRVRSLRPQHP